MSNPYRFIGRKKESDQLSFFLICGGNHGQDVIGITGKTFTVLLHFICKFKK